MGHCPFTITLPLWESGMVVCVCIRTIVTTMMGQSDGSLSLDYGYSHHGGGQWSRACISVIESSLPDAWLCVLLPSTMTTTMLPY